MIELETGLMLESHSYYFGGRYVMQSKSASRLLREHQVRGYERNVLDWLQENLVGNRVTNALQRVIAVATGIAQPRVCQALDRLEELGILLHVPGSTDILLNPLHFFVGSPKQQYLALDDWNNQRVLRGMAARKRRGRRRREKEEREGSGKRVNQTYE